MSLSLSQSDQARRSLKKMFDSIIQDAAGRALPLSGRGPSDSVISKVYYVTVGSGSMAAFSNLNSESTRNFKSSTKFLSREPRSESFSVTPLYLIR
jgi:hypothetical protein